MIRNLLFLTKSNDVAYSLIIDLTNHLYNYCDYDNPDVFISDDRINNHIINKELFDEILNTIENDSNFEEVDEVCSQYLLEFERPIPDKAKMLKNEVLSYIKDGLIGYSEERIEAIFDHIRTHGVETANYLVEDDILNIYRKYIEKEITAKTFSNYAYFLAWVLLYNKIYKNDNLNYFVSEIQWAFDGLSFCDCGDEENRETDPSFYCYIKSCCYNAARIRNSKYIGNTLIKGRYKIYVFKFRYDSFMYIIKDTKLNIFNYGNFNLDTYDFKLDYFYYFLKRDDFYDLLERYLERDDDVPILDRTIDINNI